MLTILTAVLLAGLVAIALHFLWYSGPLFRWLWSRIPRGVDTVGMQALSTRLRVVLTTFLAYLIVALFLAVLAQALKVETAGAGARLGVMLWLGFVFPTSLVSSVYAERSVAGYVVDVLFPLLFLLLAGMIIGSVH